jgi:hypothetical protein
MEEVYRDEIALLYRLVGTKTGDPVELPASTAHASNERAKGKGKKGRRKEQGMRMCGLFFSTLCQQQQQQHSAADKGSSSSNK